MANFKEIEKAIKILNKIKKLTIMQCTSLYPTPNKEANLKIIKKIKKNLT